MSKLYESKYRHARYFLRVLSDFGRLYELGGARITDTIHNFDQEWGQIEAAQAWSATQARGDARAAELATAFGRNGIFLTDLYLIPAEQMDWLKAALAAAQSLNLQGDIATHLMHLGLAHKSLGQYAAALSAFEKALKLFEDNRDEHGSGLVYANMGSLYTRLDDPHRAIELHVKANAYLKRADDSQAWAANLANLGNAYMDLGETTRAVAYYEQALDLAQQVGDVRGEGNYLGYLGLAYDALSDRDQAKQYYEQALTLARTIGDRTNERDRLGDLGRLHYNSGSFQEAGACLRQALKLAEALGDGHAQGVYLGNLALIDRENEEFDAAQVKLNRALTIARTLEDRPGESLRLNSIGLAHAAAGERKKAFSACTDALAVAREIDFRQGKMMALANLGKICVTSGDLEEAIDFFEQALVLAVDPEFSQLSFDLARAYHEFGKVEHAIDYYGSALTHFNEGDNDRSRETIQEWLGRACREVGLAYLSMWELDSALTYLEQAQDAFLKTKSPDLEPLADELAFVRAELS